ncbi:hypothetical protein NDU88_006472 [Pleurodeles waltl]|uniref:Uncharacterized protein n=1 Tax=Pleurodeles waltl TaxID=8319 RepID=A0AAV7UL42_PLEWA|nr:hypothetical protein NDU88_006472 [Pleurodeles waltl]
MVPQCGDNLVECHHDCTHCGTDGAQFFPEPHVLALLHGLDLLEPGQDRRHRLLGVVVVPALSDVFPISGMLSHSVDPVDDPLP